ncbi:MAG TPA: outer membrane beta-barrel protein [Flavisolibacter sp.]
MRNSSQPKLTPSGVLQILLWRTQNTARRWLLLVFYLTTVFSVFGQSIVAQDKWNVALRAGVNFPVKDLGATALKTGFGFDGSVGYKVMPHLFVNAGWGWNRFAAENNSDIDYEETGYSLGLQFVHPIAQSNLRYILGANVIYNHIEVENSDGDIIADTGHGFGWQAEAGLGIPFGKRTRLIPSIRYRALARELKIGNATGAEVDLNYVSIGLGFSWNF